MPKEIYYVDPLALDPPVNIDDINYGLLRQEAEAVYPGWVWETNQYEDQGYKYVKFAFHPGAPAGQSGCNELVANHDFGGQTLTQQIANQRKEALAASSADLEAWRDKDTLGMWALAAANKLKDLQDDPDTIETKQQAMAYWIDREKEYIDLLEDYINNGTAQSKTDAANLRGNIGHAYFYIIKLATKAYLD